MLIIAKPFIKLDWIINQSLLKDSSVLEKKKNSYCNTKPIRHNNKLWMNHKGKGDISNVQSIGEEISLIARRASLNKLFVFALLHALFLLYVLERWENIIEEKTLVSARKLSKDNVLIWTQMSKKMKYRILVEKPKDSTDRFIYAHKFFLEKKKNSCNYLPDKVVQACKDYLSMMEELKDRIFFSREEFNIFFSILRKKQKIMEIEAPELLNEHDDKDIFNAKILNYYTYHLHNLSKIQQLCKTLEDYNNVLSLYEKAWNKRYRQFKFKSYDELHMLDQTLQEKNPYGNIAIHTRLKYYFDEIAEATDSTVKNIMENEKEILDRNLSLCNQYKDILLEREAFMKHMKLQQQKLYNIEQEMVTTMPEFYSLYKWMSVPEKPHFGK